MQDTCFCYDAKTKSWVELQEKELAEPDISCVPVTLVMNFSHERTGEEWQKVWCPEHQTYEDIEEMEATEIVTASGCHLKGLVTDVHFTAYQSWYSYDSPASRIDKVRYRVLHRPDEDTVYIITDSVTIKYAWNQNSNESYTLFPKAFIKENISRKISIAPGNESKDTTGAFPVPVILKVMEALHEDAIRIYGGDIRLLTPPTDELGYDCRWNDRRAELWLDAFFHRPLDMNIYFFKKYFGKDEKFNEMFPKEQRDNFPLLAKALNIAPTNEMRKAYEDNPLSIILHLLLPELGIRDMRLIRKFSHLKSFCGKSMNKEYGDSLFFDPLHITEGENDNETLTEFESLRFYCLWRLRNESEEELADFLLEKQKNWRNWKYDALMAFKLQFEHVPEDLREEILQDGISGNVYDRLMIIQQHILSQITDSVCDEKALSRECKVNDYNFRLVRSIVDAVNIHRAHPFILEKREVFAGKTLYTIERNGRYLGVVRVNGDSVEREEIRDYNDRILQAKCNVAYVTWARHHNLQRVYYDPEYVDTSKEQELNIEPVDRDDEWDRISLMDMLGVPKNRIRHGYYLQLYRKFVTVPLLKPCAPGVKDDEQDYLFSKFHLGRPIFEAAFAGNPEAQYVMSIFYRDGYCITPNLRLADEWYNRAKANGWQKIAPAKKDIHIESYALRVKRY